MFFLFLVCNIVQAQDLLVEPILSKQEGYVWAVTYRVTNKTKDDIRITLKDIGVETEGFVSNSKLQEHSRPLLSKIKLNGLSGDSWFIEHSTICKDKVKLDVPDMNLPANQSGVFKLIFIHEHDIYGKYEFLLGKRHIKMSVLGNVIEHDIEVEPYEPIKVIEKWDDKIPNDLKDNNFYVTAPSSLALNCDEYFSTNYSSNVKDIKPNSKLKVTFWYYVASNTEGDFILRLYYYKNDSNCRENYEKVLTEYGRWIKKELLIPTPPDVNSVKVTFKLDCESKVGAAWIDDLYFEDIEIQEQKGP